MSNTNLETPQEFIPSPDFPTMTKSDSTKPLKTKRRHTWIFLSLLVILLIVIGTVSIVLFRLNSLYKSFSAQTFWYHPNPNPDKEISKFADWQTYRNEEYGFEIKYPDIFFLPNTYDRNNLIQVFLVKKNSTVPEQIDGSNQIVEIQIHNQNSMFDDYFTSPVGSTVYDENKITKSYSIDDIQFIEYNNLEQAKIIEKSYNYSEDISSAKIFRSKGLLIQKDKIIIHISTDFYNGSFQKTFDQILSTFQFIDPSNSNSTTLDSKEKCLGAGGVWQSWGLFPGEYCQIPAQDGGKACTDGSECELNSCITYKDSQNGQCRTYEDTFGCYSELTDGKMSTTLCFD